VANPLYTPRINNNDDTVRLTKILVAIGAPIRRGDPILDIETDKAGFTVEAEQDGYLLGVLAQPGDTINVGSILAWIGSNPDDAMPAAERHNGDATSKREVSLKASLLLSAYGISASSVPASGDRLSGEDVRRYIEAHGLRPAGAAATRSVARAPGPQPPGRTVDLTPIERGMLRTVEWHRDEAAAAYVEISYDPSAWQDYAAEFQKSKRSLVSPLLALLAWKLAQLAKTQPEINTTMVGESRYAYDHVNLGFTVQAGERLYVVVVPEAESMNEIEFVGRLNELQRAAMKNALSPKETSGATIAFSSMARWAVTRHVPVLVPYTSLMVAHTAPQAGAATLGATYDHRVLSGWHAVRVLQSLARIDPST
jgi:pyruvate/2-oxoglutarate dehydrogenase complex dihydrolipoamide acyltransferase (E2) component